MHLIILQDVETIDSTEAERYTDMATLGQALAITAEAFKHKTDKGGRPYMEHCLYVMSAGSAYGDEVMSAFLMHDLLEDCPDWTAERLIQVGFSRLTVDIVIAMTKLPGESYENDYIKRIALNKYARIGKRRDLQHNMDITRLKGLRRKDFDRLEKYARAYEYLKD